MKRLQSGFTLIELMIVVAIIGILSAIAVPQYQDYVGRSRWSDNFAASAQLKQAISECMQSNNQVGPATAPCDTLGSLTAAGHLPTGFTLSLKSDFGSVAYASGVVSFTGGRLTGGASCTVDLVPVGAVSQITWTFINTGAAACNRTRTGVGT